jgi:hypothetical protein
MSDGAEGFIDKIVISGISGLRAAPRGGGGLRGLRGAGDFTRETAMRPRPVASQRQRARPASSSAPACKRKEMAALIAAAMESPRGTGHRPLTACAWAAHAREKLDFWPGGMLTSARPTRNRNPTPLAHCAVRVRGRSAAEAGCSARAPLSMQPRRAARQN